MSVSLATPSLQMPVDNISLWCCAKRVSPSCHYSYTAHSNLKCNDVLCSTVDSLSRDGEYAGNDVVVAFTRAFSTHVVIHQLNTPRWEITAPPTATPTSSASPTLHIAYMNGEHYCCVLPATAEHALPEISAASKMVLPSPPLSPVQVHLSCF